MPPYLLNVPIYYYIAAAVMFIGVLVFAKRLPLMRRIGLSLLLPYLFLVLCTTVILRAPSETANVFLEPFYSYRQYAMDDFTNFEIRANVLLFIPIGFLIPMSAKRFNFSSVLIGVAVSAGIEFLQFVTHRGTCETDDLISNFFGIMIGYIFFLIFKIFVLNIYGDSDG